MKQIFQIFEDKLHRNNLADKETPLMGISYPQLLWNKEDKACEILGKLFEFSDTKAVLFSQPAEPYKTIIDYLAEISDGTIHPQDCETRHFLHDLPVAFTFDSETVISALKTRKCVILPGHGILAASPNSLEKAYVTFSSVCFACFVKFFSDFLYDARHGNISQKQQNALDHAAKMLNSPAEFNDTLMKAPFDSEKAVYAALEEAGKLTVEYGLVDSCFGNISYFYDNRLHISRTGSFLDNLKNDIVSCLPDDSPCNGASSELPAHRRIIQTTDAKAILHGHPRFSVILSMDCDVRDCEHRGECHLKCQQERFACGIPVVPGEVGGGDYGLCNTVPDAVKNNSGVIVYGHGLFTTGKADFNEPFRNLLEIENACRREYFERIKSFGFYII